MSQLKMKNTLDWDVYVMGVQGANGQGKLCGKNGDHPVDMGALTSSVITITLKDSNPFPANCNACYDCKTPGTLPTDRTYISLDVGTITATDEDDKNVTIGQPQPC